MPSPSVVLRTKQAVHKSSSDEFKLSGNGGRVAHSNAITTIFFTSATVIATTFRQPLHDASAREQSVRLGTGELLNDVCREYN